MSFFSGLKKVLNFGGSIRGGDGGGNGRARKLPTCLRMEVDPCDEWSFVGELGDGAFGKVYKVKDFEKFVTDISILQVSVTKYRNHL